MISAETEVTSPFSFVDAIVAPTKIISDRDTGPNITNNHITIEFNSTSSSSASQANEAITAEQIVGPLSSTNNNVSSSNQFLPLTNTEVSNSMSSPAANSIVQPTDQRKGYSSTSVCEATFEKHGELVQQVSSHVQPTAVSVSKRSGMIMHVRTQTWAADSHELFDYESRNILLNEFKCGCMRDSYQICRVGTEVHFLAGQEAKAFYASEPTAKILAHIVWSNDGYYYLSSPSYSSVAASPNGEEASSQDDHKLWLVVRYLRNRSVIVNSGDILKLGRFKIQIKDALTTPQESKYNRVLYSADDNDDCETVAPDAGDTQDIFTGPKNISSPKKQSVKEDLDYTNLCTKPTYSKSLSTTDYTKRCCRICLWEGSDIDDLNELKLNPLIAPCECKGSLEWVHLQCLRTWISGRLNIRNDSSSFFWKSLECELCKITYPTYVRVKHEIESTNGKAEDTSEGNEENCSLRQNEQLVYGDHFKSKQLLLKQFELLRRQTYSVELFEFPRPDVPYVILEPKTQQADKGFHVVGLAHNRVARLGRGHESDVRIADISVSRLHSLLRYQSVATMKRHLNSLVGSSGFGGPNLFNAHGCFMIQDHHSKFGTLLELQQPFRLDTNFPAVSIQAGRTIITISLRRRWRLRMPACISQKQHALSSDIYVLFRQPQQSSVTRDKEPRVETQQNL